MSATIARNDRHQRPPVARVATPRVPDPDEHPHGTQLAEAVLRVQAAAPKLIRNALGQVQGRTYGYVTNDAIVDAVLPLLVEQDLFWRVFATDKDGQPALRYRMTHIPSGEYEEDVVTLKLAKQDMQALGSAQTYGRRYVLVAYLNLTVDPDDDGTAAGASGASERPCSESQRKMLHAKARAASLTAVQFANAVKATQGEAPSDSTDESAAERFLERALEHLPARRVDDLIARIESAGSRA